MKPAKERLMQRDDYILTVAHTLLEELCNDAKLSGVGIAIVQIVELIDRAGSAIPELTRAILSEPFIAQKLLQSSNAVLIRRGATPVTQLSKAIVLLGFEQVRTIALSTLLLSKLGNEQQRARFEGEFATLLYAATLARETAASMNICDPEEAAVCTLFRWFGRLIVGLYRYEFYEKILIVSLKDRISENQAAVRVLGLSFDGIGMALLARWGVPQRIVQSLSPCPEVVRCSNAVEVRLKMLACFCMEVALTLRPPLLNERQQTIESLLQRFGPALRLDRERFNAQLELVDTQALEMSRAMGLSACPNASRFL